MSLPTEPQSWLRDGFIISTDKNLLSIPSINTAFGEEFMYWTSSVPDQLLAQIIQNSFCFGLYKAPSQQEDKAGDHHKQVGFARLVTDCITFAYLTDVYVLPEYQGLGLGGWLLDCVDQSLEALPYLRWTMLRTSSQKSKESYERRMGMSILSFDDVKNGPVMMGKKGKANRV
jgi:ribosomal protein S18 acetylase RimI-like enzyme